MEALEIEELPQVPSIPQTFKDLGSAAGLIAIAQLIDVATYFYIINYAGGLSASNAVALNAIGVMSANVSIAAIFISLISQKTREAIKKKSDEELAQVFLTAHVLPILPSLIATAVNYIYLNAFPLPDDEAQHAMQTFYAKTMPAMWALLTAVSQVNFAVCAHDSWMALIYLISPLTLATTFFTLTSLPIWDRLAVADTIGLFILPASYLLSVALRPTLRKNLAAFCKRECWYEAWRQSFGLLKNGIYPALPAIAQLISFLLTTQYINDLDQRKAYLINQFYNNAFLGERLVLFAAVAGNTVNSIINFSGKGLVYEKTMWRIQYCAAIAAMLIPLGLLISSFSNADWHIERVLSAADQSDLVKDIIRETLPLAITFSLLSILLTVLQPNIVVLATQAEQDKRLKPQVYNLSATAALTVTPFITFAMGYGLAAKLPSAFSYYLAALICLPVTGIALQKIANASNKVQANFDGNAFVEPTLRDWMASKMKCGGS